ncbi:Nuclear transcription factor [Sarcoptes scabiei]|nr:Nuclear transcription factor [Sarcoptes scabiei]
MAPLSEELSKTTCDSQENFELESQFILRLPYIPAASLRVAIKSGVLNLKERLTIQIDEDIRNGTVRFDGWVLPAKIVDLPTIIESHKTLDNKNFYKTADISQMMICKEEADESKEDIEEVAKKTKDGKILLLTKDSSFDNNIIGKDKKYMFPHGITKPLKNVRKRRFRKTLKKKNADFPEIEKEVKRLLRQDNEAKHVRFEIVNIEEDTKTDKEKDSLTNMNPNDVDLFGDVVSSSDDDDNDGMGLSDEGSRMSTTFRDYLKDSVDEIRNDQDNGKKYTNFLEALQSENIGPSNSCNFDYIQEDSAENTEASYSLTQNMENESVKLKLQDLENEIQMLQNQRITQQLELDSIENLALKQRFQTIIDDLKNQETLKKKEYDELKKTLFSTNE